MNITTVKRIDWDALIEGYGPEAKNSIRELLSQYEIDEEDPIALLIASMFLSQVDTMRAFDTISEAIETGRSNLSDEFSEQILKLRGLIAYAEEHLVETSKEQIDERQGELLSVVKAGVSQAIARSSQRSHAQNTAGTIALAIAVSGLCVLSLVAGGLGYALIFQPQQGSQAELSKGL